MGYIKAADSGELILMERPRKLFNGGFFFFFSFFSRQKSDLNYTPNLIPLHRWLIKSFQSYCAIRVQLMKQRIHGNC